MPSRAAPYGRCQKAVAPFTLRTKQVIAPRLRWVLRSHISPLIVPLLYPGFGRVTEFLRPHFRITSGLLTIQAQRAGFRGPRGYQWNLPIGPSCANTQRTERRSDYS